LRDPMARSALSMATLMMSAAEPWMGLFRAIRRPACWMFRSGARSSGTWRWRPKIVSETPFSRASSTIRSR
jgi:hypothetical protein